MRIYQEDIVRTMDERLCRLHSFGILLTQLCQQETLSPDIPSLADLGKVIAEEADLVLNMIQDGAEAPATVDSS